MRYAAYLPNRVNEKIKAEYYVDRARQEIAALKQDAGVRNSASVWPELDVSMPVGLTPTQELLDTAAFSLGREPIVSWPMDSLKFSHDDSVSNRGKTKIAS